MKILFLGSFIPVKYEIYVPLLSAAGNKFQNNCINALKIDNKVIGLSFLSLPVNCEKENLTKDACKNNFKIVYAKDNRIASYFQYRKLLKKYLVWADCVITYNVIYAWFNLPKNKKCKNILILADYTPAFEEKSLPKKIYAYLMRREFEKYDKVVMLSSKSEKYLNKNQNKVVINGCINWDDFKNIKKPVNKPFINIVYSGALTKVGGIDLLINAFLRINNPEIRLIVCGQGDEFNNLIEEACKLDNRINYKGYVTRSEYMDILNESDILVNPRNMKLKQNENNFPSKILEYLAAGRYIISTKFSGYENYMEYIHFVESDELEIAKAIELTVNNYATDLNIEDLFNKNRDFAKKLDWKNQIKNFL